MTIIKQCVCLACVLFASSSAHAISQIKRNDCGIAADVAAAAYQARHEGYPLNSVIQVIKQRGIIDRPRYITAVKRAYQVTKGTPERDFRIGIFEKCVSEG